MRARSELIGVCLFRGMVFSNLQHLMYDSVVFLSRRLVSVNTGCQERRVSVSQSRNSCDKQFVFLFLPRLVCDKSTAQFYF